jgi:hypothetical protein
LVGEINYAGQMRRMNCRALALLALFFLEMLRLAIKRRLKWSIVGVSVAALLTSGVFIQPTFGLIAVACVAPLMRACSKDTNLSRPPL